MVTSKNIKNFLALGLSEGVSNLIFLGVIIYLARILGAEGLGKVTFARSLIIYFMLAANAGLDLYAIRSGSRDHGRIPALITQFLSLRLIFACIGYLLVVVLVVFLPKDMETKHLLLIYGGMLFAAGLLVEWPFQATERMHYMAIGRILGEVVFLAATLLFIRSPEKILWVPVSRVLGGMFQLFLMFFLCMRFYGKMRLAWEPVIWKDILKQSLPMGTGFIMVQVYSNMDNIMLGFMRDNRSVGLYAAAYKLLMVIVLVGIVFHKVLYPSFARLYHESVKKMELLLQQALKTMMVVALPVMGLAFILADRLILLFFGAEYSESIPVFRILLLKVILMWINGLNANVVLASDRERHYLFSVMIGAGANLILNFIFIPMFGMLGAALATVLSELAVFVYFYKLILSKFHPRELMIYPRIFASLFVCVGFWFWLWPLFHNVWLIAPILLFVYFLILIILKVLNPKRMTEILYKRINRNKS
jgi:O-antigen/teichoic acid export membrane protein